MKKDTQLTGMAGEFLVAGKLFKRQYQVSITLGNAKGIDILVYNPSNNKTFTVQVKTQRSKNNFPIKREDIDVERIYIFVRLNNFENVEQYFILKGDTILNNINKFFGGSYKIENNPVPAINYGSLNEYENNWSVFDEL